MTAGLKDPFHHASVVLPIVLTLRRWYRPAMIERTDVIPASRVDLSLILLPAIGWLLADRLRDLALFNLAIDSKLRGCDLVSLRVNDVSQGRNIFQRAIVMQQKTQRPVQFEITEATRQSVLSWIDHRKLTASQHLFPSRAVTSAHLSTRQYARIVSSWARSIGLDATAYGTHTMRRTKATLIYRRTRNLRAVQLLLGHTKLESTVRYLGIEVDDALEIAEQTEV
jgi:integrase